MSIKPAFILLLLGITLLGSIEEDNLRIWPKPKLFSNGTESFKMDCACGLGFFVTNNVTNDTAPAHLISIISFYFYTIIYRTHEPELRNCPLRINDYSPSQTNDELTNISIYMDNWDLVYPNTTHDEFYEMNLYNITNWTIHSVSLAGLIRAMETLAQIIYYVDGWYYFDRIPIKVVDEPSYLYRGMMIDTSRHYLSLEMIEKVIDTLMYNKMNVLHWHITDDDSFPLFSRTYPNISEYGAFSQYEKYSVYDIDEIMYYAKKRGIRVIPEIDTPGHTYSWGYAPELANITLNCTTYAFGQFDPTLNLTYDVVKGVMNDTDKYFDVDYIHFGGDEVVEKCWDQRPEIKDFMTAHNIQNYSELQSYYRKRQKEIFRAEVNSTKKIMYWANKQLNLPLDEDDVIHWWGLTKDLEAIKEKKNKIVLSNYDLLYLDAGFGNRWGNNYSEFHTWNDIYYGFDPEVKDINGTIIGAEACLWSEINNEATQMEKMWMRGSALAERLWNPKANADPKKVVMDRVISFQKNITFRGIHAAPVTSEYCERNPMICFQD